MTGKKRRSVPRRKPSKPVHISVPVTVPERGLKIGEAARLLGVEAFVLRFWETQFAILKPRHTRTKHRFYQKRDIEALRLIKRLLHDEGFTIAGANKHIKERGIEALLAGSSREKASRSVVHSAGDEPALDGTARRVLSELRRDLQSLRKMLD